MTKLSTPLLPLLHDRLIPWSQDDVARRLLMARTEVERKAARVIPASLLRNYPIRKEQAAQLLT
jgi:hypothetical protein